MQPTTLTPTPEAPPQENKKFWHDVGEIVQTLLLAVILYFAIDAVFARVRVENISMENTVMPGDLLVVNKLAYKLGPYHTGDIVVFHNPLDVKEDFIKRIIGTPGDTVSIHNEQVMVNGVVLHENYIREAPDYDGDWVVPQGNIFVLGDNRNQSDDSHSWGFVPDKDVVGRVIFEYWPLNQVKPILNPFK